MRKLPQKLRICVKLGERDSSRGGAIKAGKRFFCLTKKNQKDFLNLGMGRSKRPAPEQ
jgi:hypothetical protein